MSASLRKTARNLAWFTLAYNLAEAGACAWFGVRDGALALMGFGVDSMIEAAAAGVILWRFRHREDDERAEARERSAQRLIATLLVGLSVYLVISAWFEFRSGKGPDRGLPGVVIAIVSLAVMAWLYRAKMACAVSLKSAALKADAFCTLSCMWLSGLLLAGSALLEGTGLKWFDALTSLGMAFLIAREGMEEYDEALGVGDHDDD